MFLNFFLKSFRFLLFPFAIVYWMVIKVRNILYNKRVFKEVEFALPIICVGNLSVGGTGKSPMVEYLIRLLKDSFSIATLSRGYKRKTRGYTLATNSSTALEIGDEPMQLHKKFPHVPVAVGEERLVAIAQLLHDKPSTQVIIMDDAFQHRKVKAGLNILLTDYHNLFTRDFYLPTGDLRDLKSEYKRAHIIVVTKTSLDITANEKDAIIAEIKPQPGQHIFFATTRYHKPRHLITQTVSDLDSDMEVLLVTGIANPRPLKRMMEKRVASYQLMAYRDHHIFTIDDLNDIKEKFAGLPAQKKIIITTEKDGVRFEKFFNEMSDMPIYVIPIEHEFMFEDKEKFDNLIIQSIQKAKRPL